MLFNDVIGQQKTKEILLRSVREGRVPHAQLFLGSDGSAKLALALAFAQYVCCTEKREEDSCGVCASCVKHQKKVQRFVLSPLKLKLLRKLKLRRLMLNYLNGLSFKFVMVAVKK